MRTGLGFAASFVLAASATYFAPAATAAPPTSSPQNVRLTAIGFTIAQWSWDAVPNATSYRVSIASVPTFSDAKVRVVTSRWATFKPLAVGTVYYFAVRAIGPAGTSAPSAKVTGHTSNVNLFHADQPTDGALAYSWFGYLGANQYRLELSSYPAFTYSRIRTVDGTQTAFEDLVPGKTYYARIRALSHGVVISRGDDEPITAVPTGLHP